MELNIYTILSIVTFVFSLFLGIYIIVSNPYSKVNKIFFLWMLSVSAGSFSEFYMLGAESKESAMLWAEMMGTGFIFSLAFLLHFTFIFPTESRMFVKHRHAFVLIYPPAIVFSLLLFLFPPLVQKEPWGYSVGLRVFSLVYAIYYAGYLSFSLANLLSAKKSAESRLQSEQINYVIVGVAIPFIYFTMSCLIFLLLGFTLYQATTPVTAVMVAFIAVAVLRHRLVIVSPREERIKLEEEAPCGALCIECINFREGKCLGCDEKNRSTKQKCPVYICSNEKGLKCKECELFKDCKILSNAIKECPFRIPRYNLHRGDSYLIEGEDVGKAYEMFVDLVIRGFYGLCITRKYPRKVRERYNLKETPVLWLARSLESSERIDPQNIVSLMTTIQEFLGSERNTVVLIDGIEYLISQNGYPTIIKFFQALNEQVSTTDSILLVPVNPKAVNKINLKILEREMEIVPAKQ